MIVGCDRAAALNAELEAGFGTTVSVRTGVNTGQVVTGTAERLATGDAVNLAARLEQAAAPGEIVIGPLTWRLVREAVRAEPLEPLVVKGKSQPVAAYRLLESQSAAEPARRAGAPLVGRARQLRLLGDVYANVTRECSCSLFTILGTAGVGKSRLAAEFLAGVQARVLTGRCLPYGEGITYSPVLAMLAQLLDGEHSCAASVEMMRENAQVAAAVGIVRGRRVAVTSPAEIAWAVRKLLEACAGQGPLVVVFDDLQWAEPALLDLIEHVADFSRDVPILVLCLARPELLERRDGWGGGKLNAATVLLEPLDAAETLALIDELIPDGSLDTQLREQVQSTAAGNPLFVEEILALLRESGGTQVVVPPTIEALLAARLDQLPAPERTALECGSVEGQSFHRGPVQALAPEEPDVPAQLMNLVHKDLLRPDRPILPDEDAFRFRHLLIRDAAYAGLAKADRAELHQRFAAWLEQHGASLAELDEITGYHLEQAYRYRTELAPPDDTAWQLATQAAGHLQAAGLRALQRGDLPAALNLLGRAAALLPPGQINPALQHGLIMALGGAAQYAEAASRAARIAAQCASAGDRVGELRFKLLESLERLGPDAAGHFDQFRALVEEARPVIEQRGDPAALAVLEDAAGAIPFFLLRWDAALAAFTRAIEQAKKAGDLWFETVIRISAGFCLMSGSLPVDKAIEQLQQPKMCAAHERFFDLYVVYLLALAGHFERARMLLADTRAHIDELGDPLAAAMAMEGQWRLEMLAGDLPAAERGGRQYCEQAERMGAIGVLSTQACLLADLLCAQGRYEEAAHWVQRGLDLGHEKDLATQLAGLRVRSKLLAHNGEHTAALELARHVEELAQTSDSPVDRGDAALNLAEVLFIAGDRTGAQDAVGRATSCYTRKGATALVSRAQRLAAQWATA